MTHNRYHPGTSLELNQEIKEQFNYRFIGSGYIIANEEQLETNDTFKTATEFPKEMKRACCAELGSCCPTLGDLDQDYTGTRCDKYCHPAREASQPRVLKEKLQV